MKELTLKNSDLKALVDDEDYPRLATRTWRYQIRKQGLPQVITADCDQIPLRKAVLHRHEGYPAVIHRNGDPLDCRKENLAEITQAEITLRVSKRKPKPGASGKLGVIHYQLRDEWKVVVYHRDAVLPIGNWKDLDHAARAYDHAVELIKGPDAPTNLALGYLKPDAISPAEDAVIRQEVEKAVRTGQPRYPRPAVVASC